MNTHFNKYEYDGLNRIKKQEVFAGPNSEDLVSLSSSNDPYETTYSYDANGNITDLTRRNSNGLLFDNLVYSYNSATNQLNHIDDNATSNISLDLITQPSNNYIYDLDGNLVKDVSEQIDEITWTVSGKIKEIKRVSGSTKPNMEFSYDAMGNRILKIVKPRPTGSVVPEEEWSYIHYVWDAQGNVMAIYERKFEELTPGVWKESVNLEDMPVYGSSRLGMNQPRQQYYTAQVVNGSMEETFNLQMSGLVHQMRGYKSYEMTNHLGNVPVVVSDRKLPQGTTTVNSFEPDIITYSDYYPFGWIMPGREGLFDHYRYGFNGMEKDYEIKGNGNHYTTFWRQYDPRIGRWMSIDPEMAKYPGWSPYVFSFNNPINFTDPDGDDPCSDGDGKAKRECRTFKNKKLDKKPRFKKVKSKTIIKEVVKQAKSIKGKRTKSNENFSESFDVPEEGEFKVEFDAFSVPDKFTVFDAETGEKIGGSDNFESGKQEVLVPEGTNRIRVDVERNKTESTRFKVRLRSTKLIKKTTIKRKIRGRKNTVRRFESKAKEGDKIGKKRRVRKGKA